MHHYRTREDETPCGGDPYFYLRLSAGAAPYSPIKLEVDVKPEPHMTPVDCLQHSSPPADSGSAVMDTVGGCGNAAVVADIGGCGGVIVGSGAGVRCKDEGGSTGIGLLALTQLDGYGGYNNKSYCHADGGAVDLQLQHDRVGDDDVDKEHCKYSYGRLIYSSPDDDNVIKHQVFSKLSSLLYMYIIVMWRYTE